jgi:hypothetical protein
MRGLAFVGPAQVGNLATDVPRVKLCKSTTYNFHRRPRRGLLAFLRHVFPQVRVLAFPRLARLRPSHLPWWQIGG